MPSPATFSPEFLYTINQVAGIKLSSLSEFILFGATCSIRTVDTTDLHLSFYGCVYVL